jgi:hypothetical protein
MLKNSRSAQYQAAAMLPSKLRYGLSGTVMQVGRGAAAPSAVPGAHICLLCLWGCVVQHVHRSAALSPLLLG